MENSLVTFEGFSKNLLAGKNGNYYLKHQKILTFVDKVSGDEIVQILDIIIDNMKARLDAKVTLPNISSVSIEELGKNSKIFLISGSNIHLMNKYDTGIIGGKTPPPKPPPVDISNNTLHPFKDQVYTLSQMYKNIESDIPQIRS